MLEETRINSDAIGFGNWAGRCVRTAKEMLSDLPKAIEREYIYHASVRRNAILVLTWACTSRCKTCTAWRRERDEANELSVRQWCDTAGELVRGGAKSFELFGGDVFLRKALVIELSAYLHSLGASVLIPTNANLLDEKTASQLVKSVSVFYLSTDGLEQSHDELRGRPGTFGRVRQAVSMLRKVRAGAAAPRLICNTTVSRYNADRLAEIAAFAVHAGFDDIHLEYVGEFTDRHVQRSRIGNTTPSPIYIQTGESALIRPEQVPLLRKQLILANRLAKDCRESGRKFRVTSTRIDVLSDDDLVNGTVPGNGRCYFDRCTAVIDPYGNVVPCIFFDNYSLGNVQNGGLDRSANSPRRRMFRSLRDRGKLEMCKHCIMGVVRNRTGLDVLKRAYIVGQKS